MVELFSGIHLLVGIGEQMLGVRPVLGIESRSQTQRQQIRATDFQTRHLLLALQAGEPMRLVRGLARVGACVSQTPGGLVIDPVPLHRGVVLDTQHDHRLAMAWGVLSLGVPGVAPAEPGCVTKSYPAFWRDLEAIRV